MRQYLAKFTVYTHFDSVALLLGSYMQDIYTEIFIKTFFTEAKNVQQPKHPPIIGN